MIRDIRDHGAQIFEVDEQPALVVRHAEYDGKHARLNVGEPQQTRQQGRTHFAHRGPDRMSAFAVNIPKAHGIAFQREIRRIDPHPAEPLFDSGVHGPRLYAAAEVALDVGEEYRDAEVGEGLRHDLQRYGLAGPGRARDKTVSVCHCRQY